MGKPRNESGTAARTEARKAEQARELARLLALRPDLAGAYAPADLTVEAIRWSA